MPKDIWNLTPAELDDLMRRAAWMLEYPDKTTSAEKYEVWTQLRRSAPQVNPAGYTSLAGAEEHYRPGVYNGD